MSSNSERLVEVALPLPINRTFTYSVPYEYTVGNVLEPAGVDGQTKKKFNLSEPAGQDSGEDNKDAKEAKDTKALEPGLFVEVEFGARKKKLRGCIIEVHLADFVPSYKVKPISSTFYDNFSLSPLRLNFCKQLSAHYLASMGEVIQMFVPKIPKKNSRAAKKKKGVVGGNVLPQALGSFFDLNPEQNDIFNKIRPAVLNQQASTHLIHGITGSGKTEVYFHLIREALNIGKNVLFLVPEIGLTPQLKQRFEDKFPDQFEIVHSALSKGSFEKAWLAVYRLQRSIVVGTRSALFTPLENIGLIIIDEEHDQSFKQENGLKYHAREVAAILAKIYKATLVLGSATPSIETYFAAQNKRIHFHHLPFRAGSNSQLPLTTPIAMKGVKALIAPLLYEKIQENLEKKEQTLLFLNRRGYSAILECRECGFVYECPKCSVTLKYHLLNHELICHYCDYRMKAPSHCKECKNTDLKTKSYGTQRIEEEICESFPKDTVIRLDRDISKNYEDFQRILQEIRDKKYLIVVGTQLLAKGHDFPELTLVAVLNADIGLHQPDFRAPEKSFQTLTQVAGRAGRAQKPGQVYVQTYVPQHYAIRSSMKHDYEQFYKEEISQRREFLYPPFMHLCLIRFESTQEEMLKERGLQLKSLLNRRREQWLEGYHEQLKKWLGSLDADSQALYPIENCLMLLGPSEANVYQNNEWYRSNLMIKAPLFRFLQSFLAPLKLEVADLQEFKSSKVRIYWDLNPYSF